MAARLYTACQKTFSNPNNAACLGAIVACAAISSAFRWGILTSPIGIATSILFSTPPFRALGGKIISKLPNCPSAITDRIKKISEVLQRLPENSLTESIYMPAIEEVIFRGAIQTPISLIAGPILGVALSTLAFAAVHYKEDQPSHLVNSFVGGIVFGILKEQSSILASLGCHIGTNFFWSVGLGFGRDKGFLRNYLET